jgi:hypothetical protein
MDVASRFQSYEGIFEELQYIENSSGRLMKGIHNRGTVIDVLISIMAGADFIETDYPLDLATRGIALMTSKPKDC